MKHKIRCPVTRANSHNPMSWSRTTITFYDEQFSQRRARDSFRFFFFFCYFTIRKLKSHGHKFCKVQNSIVKNPTLYSILYNERLKRDYFYNVKITSRGRPDWKFYLNIIKYIFIFILGKKREITTRLGYYENSVYTNVFNTIGTRLFNTKSGR